MNILIVEDEYHAAQHLQKTLTQQRPRVEILSVLDSVRDTVEWLTVNRLPDLIFLDIQLADGLSFSIFEQVELEVPVIFTTAYGEYSLDAFKVNSIDYLLKPIDEAELANALVKYDRLHTNTTNMAHSLAKIFQNHDLKRPYRERFLIKVKDHYHFILVTEIAYFYSEDSVSFLVDKNAKSFICDASLNQLEQELNPRQFFRINRKQIIHIDAIRSIDAYFNNRLIVQLHPPPKSDSFVSREKVKAFKTWLGA